MKKDFPLSQLTTIGLGGNARCYVSCSTRNEILEALEFAEKNSLKVQVISGGSNIVFRDEGFEGLVLKINIKGIESSEDEKYVFLNSGAGENWDEFVKFAVYKSLTGIECLSGIPGSVGATPVQNVGAYGQEVKESIVSVRAIDKNTFENITFANSDCSFGYRDSRFKSADRNKYIITEVKFRFEKNKLPERSYEQLHRNINLNNSENQSKSLFRKLSMIRDTVLELRKSKSMVIDKKDPNSRSCGSFFTNPIISKDDLEKLKGKFSHGIEIPVFMVGNLYKISAAWLVEQAGFRKGHVKGGVGISKNHSLALININGTSAELLSLSEEIEKKVMKEFSIKLIKEPVIV